MVRTHVVDALGRLGQATPEVVTALLGALHDPDDMVRYRIISSLAQIESDMPEIRCALLTALDEA
jgi:HEAT repeat protein